MINLGSIIDTLFEFRYAKKQLGFYSENHGARLMGLFFSGLLRMNFARVFLSPERETHIYIFFFTHLALQT